MFRTKPAASLVEVLIILAVISTSVIASTTIAVNSQRTLIENEREETANGILIQALEIVKSPSDIFITGSFDGSPRTYRLAQQSNPQGYILEEERDPLTTCSEGSPYQVSNGLLDETINYPLCLALTIEQEPGSNRTKVEATLLYQQGAELITKTLIGFRNETFTNR